MFNFKGPNRPKNNTINYDYGKIKVLDKKLLEELGSNVLERIVPAKV